MITTVCQLSTQFSTSFHGWLVKEQAVTVALYTKYFVSLESCLLITTYRVNR